MSAGPTSPGTPTRAPGATTSTTPSIGRAVDTALGRVGLCSCTDCVTFETARMLAAEGAQLLLGSLNSFALGEASLHPSVRAPENKVGMVAVPFTVAEAHASICYCWSGRRRTGSVSRSPRPHTGGISRPEPQRADAPLTLGVLRPACATNRFASTGTAVVDGRPWQLLGGVLTD